MLPILLLLLLFFLLLLLLLRMHAQYPRLERVHRLAERGEGANAHLRHLPRIMSNIKHKGCC